MKISTVLGRRATLRYLGLGLIAAATAACQKQPSGDESGPRTTRPSVAALAAEAFAKGTWSITSTVTRGSKQDVATGELTVGNGTWIAGPGLLFEDFAATGEYTLQGGTLRVVLRGDEEYRRKYPSVKDQRFTGRDIPATVSTNSFILGWALDGEEQTCVTQWDGKTLTIAGNDFHDNQVLVTATRR